MRTKRVVLAQDTFRLYRPIGRTPVSETERSAGELALRSTQKEAARANTREQLALRKESGTKCTQKL